MTWVSWNQAERWRRKSPISTTNTAANSSSRGRETEGRGPDDDGSVERRSKKKVRHESVATHAVETPTGLRTRSSLHFAVGEPPSHAPATKKGRPARKSEVYMTTFKDSYHKAQSKKHRLYSFAVVGGSRAARSSRQGPLKGKEGRGKECDKDRELSWLWEAYIIRIWV